MLPISQDVHRGSQIQSTRNTGALSCELHTLIDRGPVAIALDTARVPSYQHTPLHDDVIGLEEPLAMPPVFLCIGMVRPLSRKGIKIGKTLRLSTRLLPDQLREGLCLRGERFFFCVSPGIASMQDHIGMVICIDWHVPLEMELAWLRKSLHLEATWHITPYPASTRICLHYGWGILGPQRYTTLLAFDFAGIDVDVVLFDNAFGLAVFFEELDDVLARWIGPKRSDAAGLLHAGPMAMTVDMRGIKTVLGSHTPVALDLVAHNRVRH